MCAWSSSRRVTRMTGCGVIVLAVGGAASSLGMVDEPTRHEKPLSMTLGALPPGFDGRSQQLFGGDWTEWRQRNGEPSRWVVTPEGAVRARGGDAISMQEWGDHQLHLEFRCPRIPGATGAACGNSGVFIHGLYEIQLLDTFGRPPSPTCCGAIHGQHPPLSNASLSAGIWQTLDIVFRAPRFDGERVVERPRITVLLNGMVVHNNLELEEPTAGGLGSRMTPTGPILLQDMGDPVEFRNIWVRTLGEGGR